MQSIKKKSFCVFKYRKIFTAKQDISRITRIIFFYQFSAFHLLNRIKIVLKKLNEHNFFSNNGQVQMVPKTVLKIQFYFWNYSIILVTITQFLINDTSVKGCTLIFTKNAPLTLNLDCLAIFICRLSAISSAFPSLPNHSFFKFLPISAQSAFFLCFTDGLPDSCTLLRLPIPPPAYTFKLLLILQ